MNRGHWVVDIDRVVVTGAPPHGLEAAELRTLVESAVAAGLADAPPPAGRTMRDAVRIASGPLAGGAPGIARAVATSVVAAIDRMASRG